METHYGVIWPKHKAKKLNKSKNGQEELCLGQLGEHQVMLFLENWVGQLWNKGGHFTDWYFFIKY